MKMQTGLLPHGGGPKDPHHRDLDLASSSFMMPLIVEGLVLHGGMVQIQEVIIHIDYSKAEKRMGSGLWGGRWASRGRGGRPAIPHHGLVVVPYWPGLPFHVLIV